MIRKGRKALVPVYNEDISSRFYIVVKILEDSSIEDLIPCKVIFIPENVNQFFKEAYRTNMTVYIWGGRMHLEYKEVVL